MTREDDTDEPHVPAGVEETRAQAEVRETEATEREASE